MYIQKYTYIEKASFSPIARSLPFGIRSFRAQGLDARSAVALSQARERLLRQENRPLRGNWDHEPRCQSTR